jgi:hypothetical protein
VPTRLWRLLRIHSLYLRDWKRVTVATISDGMSCRRGLVSGLPTSRGGKQSSLIASHEVLRPRLGILISSTSDGAANVTGLHSGWKSLVENACEGKGPLFRVYCGPHRLNLANGRAIAAFRSTGFKRLDKLYLAVKLLWKKANLIVKMGCQSPYHVEAR